MLDDDASPILLRHSSRRIGNILCFTIRTIRGRFRTDADERGWRRVRGVSAAAAAHALAQLVQHVGGHEQQGAPPSPPRALGDEPTALTRVSRCRPPATAAPRRRRRRTRGRAPRATRHLTRRATTTGKARHPRPPAAGDSLGSYVFVYFILFRHSVLSRRRFLRPTLAPDLGRLRSRFINRLLCDPPARSLVVERTTVTTTTVSVPASRHTGRALAKLLVERSVSGECSEVYLTPNCSLGGPVDVIPRGAPRAQGSPASDEYRTPDSTLENGHDAPDGPFVIPTYFDKKKRAAATLFSAAVQPLTNFQVLKQKSLTTIPALMERNKRNEELFTNFPFLTPLAHRKSSLVSTANRLSGCLEDEFYCIPSEPEAEAAERIDVRHRFRSLSNQALDKEAVFTSTPKDESSRGAFAKHDPRELHRGPFLRHSYTYTEHSR